MLVVLSNVMLSPLGEIRSCNICTDTKWASCYSDSVCFSADNTHTMQCCAVVNWQIKLTQYSGAALSRRFKELKKNEGTNVFRDLS